MSTVAEKEPRTYRIATIEVKDTGYVVGLRDGMTSCEDEAHAFSTKLEAMQFVMDRIISRNSA